MSRPANYSSFTLMTFHWRQPLPSSKGPFPRAGESISSIPISVTRLWIPGHKPHQKCMSQILHKNNFNSYIYWSKLSLVPTFFTHRSPNVGIKRHSIQSPTETDGEMKRIKIRSEESLWWLVARAFVELHERSCSALAIFDFLAPHHWGQQVQIISIMKNSGGVSPPPLNRITTPYSFPVLPQADKEFTIQVHHLHDWFAGPENLVFCSPPPLSAKSSNDFDYAKLCSGVPTTRKKNYDSICIHWAVNGLRRSPPRAQNFGQKPSINH